MESHERLLRRLPANHSQRHFLEVQLHRATAGVRGENKLQKKFNEFFIESEFKPIWDVNLKIDDWKVQMDGLLLTEKCAVIMESKNISDEIHYDELTDEFYKKNSSNEKITLENPVIQLNKHTRFLTRWFQMHKINLPVTGMIVFTAKNCFFYSKPPGALICKAYQMNEYLYQILENYPQEVSSHKVNKIKKMIASNQIPYKRSPLCEFYHIDIKDVKKGVYCRNCQSLQMQRLMKTWICGSCGHRDNFAHELALQEYFSLIDNQVTNKQFREFCQINSPSVARRLLIQYDLEFTGDLKSRAYKLKKYF